MLNREKIFETFKVVSATKQKVFGVTSNAFGEIKAVLQEIAADYMDYIATLEDQVLVTYKEEGAYGATLGFGGDVLVFQMHSNVFSFEDSHPIHQHSYIKADPSRVFCGIINVYNFLGDSFKYNRENDLGYLVSRIFVNKEGHLFVEGKNELGYKYVDFSSQVVSKSILSEIIESSIKYALDFDLYTPDFSSSQLVTVAQMKWLSEDHKVATGKRLGFKMRTHSEGVKG